MPARPEPIAIVGMGCVFPGAEDLDAYWHNLERGVDAIGDVPSGRWDPVYYAPEAAGADRFYCRRGGFVDAQARFDPLHFGVMPRAADGADPDQLLALQVADAALRDAGLPMAGSWRQRAGVVLGRGGYITPGLARLEQRVRTAQQLVEILRGQIPGITEEALQALKTSFQEKLGPYGPDTAIGLVPNLAASRIANRLDLLGPAYTVDAACASSLVAVDQACRELSSRRCDVMIAGGVHLCQDVTFWSVFTQLGALSHAQQIRPFDRRADGLLIGEGAGIVVLKRLEDAERDGDRIYARVLGVGISSDGRGTSLLEPRLGGQLLALERAWEAAGVDSDSAQLVEAHGTGTVRGDETELATLARFFGPRDQHAPEGALGSVKSMIGHAMPAAGAAGLIKTALAIHHGVLPPSLHCEEPHPLLEETRFRIPSKSEPWPESTGPRRAGVNAFGFGGINAHAVLEGDPAKARARTRPRAAAAPAERWRALSAKHPADLIHALERDQPLSEGGPYRLVLFNPTPERRDLAKKVVARERPWYGHDDLWFAPRGLLADGGKTAFLFPGLEPTFDPRVEDVAEHFGESVPTAAGFKGLEKAGFAVVSVSRLLYSALGRLGVKPDALAGHSLGEWTGMVASEMIPTSEAERFIQSLVPNTLEVPDVLFVAAGCSAERAAEAIADLPDVTLSHDNCPHQIILCGRSVEMEIALSRLGEMLVLTQKLPFRSGFHSALFEPFLGVHKSHLETLALQQPRLPLWSATRCAPYPEDAKEIRALALEHLVKPVRFRELIDQMYAQGFRFFLQVGAGTSLTGFIEDTLKGRPSLAMSANVKVRSGLMQLRRVLAAAFVSGMDVNVGALEPARPSAARPLSLEVPLIRLPARPADATAKLALPAVDGLSPPVMAQFAESLRRLAQVQQDVVSAFSQQPAASPSAAVAAGVPRDETLRIAVESHPYLLDHCFYRQPAVWPHVADRYPVVPMTLSIDWLRELGERASGHAVSVLEDVQAHRWLAAAPPNDVKLHAKPVGQGKWEVAIDGYSLATVDPNASPAPWSAPPPLTAAGPSPVSAAALYRDRWMFHGPAYQGVTALTAFGEDGIDGEITASSTPGALLDCAGQLFGFWVMRRTDVDRMAFPVWLQRIELFAPAPAPGDVLTCAVRVRELGARDVRADLWLWHLNGKPYCRITGWQDRRFDSDPRLWDVLQWPEKSLLAIPKPGGYVFVADAWRNLASRELLARRYLGVRERAEWEALPPKRQGPWLNSRIALKDAARELLWREGKGALFPVEIEVSDGEGGQPALRGPFEGKLWAAVAFTEGAAVASVSRLGEPRIALVRTEQGSNPEALARAWDARFPIQKVEGERLLIDGQWVNTSWDAPYLVAWSLPS